MRAPQAPPTMLLNWLYYPPVGHAVEAYAAAAEYRAVHPDLELHVLINARAPAAIAVCCPWVHRMYPIDVDQVVAQGEAAPCLAEIPREWDYIVISERYHSNRASYSPELVRCHEVLAGAHTARRWVGARGTDGSGDVPAPGFQIFAPFRMEPPTDATLWAQQFQQAAPIFAIMLGGSSPEPIYPTIAWWKRALLRLSHTFPGVRFLITGSTISTGRRTTTHPYDPGELADLIATVPNCHNCYDVGLLNQMALIARADLFIAPHTGFAFLAPCLGTPWLAISGARWPDPTYARMPFYTVLPRCPAYPCFVEMRPECAQRIAASEQVLCMQDAALDERIADLVMGARQLLDPQFDVAAATARYAAAVAQYGSARQRVYTLDMLLRYGGSA